MHHELSSDLLLKDAQRLEPFISICHVDAPLIMYFTKTLCLAPEIVIIWLHASVGVGPIICTYCVDIFAG